MHNIEPHYNWRHLYIASEDSRSPFYGREYSEFEFSNTIYDHYIHPQWDSIGSSTLYVKLLYANYEKGFCILELIGEWNDCLYNDIMYLKREVADILIDNGIKEFILLGENVMNFHAAENDYYQEWTEDIGNGWIACINFREHIIEEFQGAYLDYFLAVGGPVNDIHWQNLTPIQLYNKVTSFITKRLPV
jgi:hypothetical protein